MAVVSMMALSFSGCGSSTANNLGGAKDGYGVDSYGMDANVVDGYRSSTYGSDMTGGYNTTNSGGAAYWDGYGINNGRPITNDLKKAGRAVERTGDDMAKGINRALTGNTSTVTN